MAQVGSCCKIPSNVRRAMMNQYECNIATPRSNSTCTLGSQEVAKFTLPSLSSCWAIALLASATVVSPAVNKSRLSDMLPSLLLVRRLADLLPMYRMWLHLFPRAADFVSLCGYPQSHGGVAMSIRPIVLAKQITLMLASPMQGPISC